MEIFRGCVILIIENDFHLKRKVHNTITVHFIQSVYSCVHSMTTSSYKQGLATNNYN